MHGVEIMYEGFHCLIGLSSDFLIGKFSGPVLHLFSFFFGNYFLQFLKLQLLIVVVPRHTRVYAVFLFNLTAQLLHPVCAVFDVLEEIQHLA